MSEKKNERLVRLMKRSGEHQKFNPEKITKRIETLIKKSPELDQTHLDVSLIVRKTGEQASDGMGPYEMDQLISEICAYQTCSHPEYECLAARVLISSIHKRAGKNFVSKIERCYNNKDAMTGAHYPLVRKEILDIVLKKASEFNDIVDYSRDYTYRYFGLRTLMKAYLLKEGGSKSSDDKLIESPQDMMMRYCIELYRDDVSKVKECYEMLSKHYFTPATPSLFNASSLQPQMSSCFLLQIYDDSLDSIYKTLYECAMISKTAGGIGLSVHRVRGTGSVIKTSNGVSNGLVPMLRVFNDTARYVDQGGGKRKGAFAVYVEPWHSDILEFLELKKNTGKEEKRARDLFYSLWVPDLFMKRVESGSNWTLFSPNEAPGLHDVYGDEFVQLYEEYEKQGLGKKTIPALELWNRILESQIETGSPYMMYKDACNSKSNQKNIGTIHSSNLCVEIIQYSSEDEIAVCNLSSIALPKFVSGGKFDFELLGKVTRLCVRNLDKLIDISYYPIDKCENSNKRHRPMGIGVQGLADVFILLKMPYESEEARRLNKKIFECMYYHALAQSCDLAKTNGPYPSYKGSPISQGILQFDMWENGKDKLSGDFDWESLREEIKTYGVRNSLLVALMPTASTSQILGNTESFEPLTSNMYTRKTLAGTFFILNRYLVEDLEKLGLWDNKMIETLKYTGGSVQNIECVPDKIKEIYKTVWEMKQKSMVEMASDRGVFIDQSQSFNVHMLDPSAKFGRSGTKLGTMHFYAWKNGLKTGMYYLRSVPAANAAQFTVNRDLLLNLTDETFPQKSYEKSLPGGRKKSFEIITKNEVCTMEEGCVSCGS